MSQISIARCHHCHSATPYMTFCQSYTIFTVHFVTMPNKRYKKKEQPIGMLLINYVDKMQSNL